MVVFHASRVITAPYKVYRRYVREKGKYNNKNLTAELRAGLCEKCYLVIHYHLVSRSYMLVFTIVIFLVLFILQVPIHTFFGLQQRLFMKHAHIKILVFLFLFSNIKDVNNNCLHINKLFFFSFFEMIMRPMR